MKRTIFFSRKKDRFCNDGLTEAMVSCRLIRLICGVFFHLQCMQVRRYNSSVFSSTDLWPCVDCYRNHNFICFHCNSYNSSHTAVSWPRGELARHFGECRRLCCCVFVTALQPVRSDNKRSFTTSGPFFLCTTNTGKDLLDCSCNSYGHSAKAMKNNNMLAHIGRSTSFSGGCGPKSLVTQKLSCKFCIQAAVLNGTDDFRLAITKGATPKSKLNKATLLR